MDKVEDCVNHLVNLTIRSTPPKVRTEGISQEEIALILNDLDHQCVSSVVGFHASHRMNSVRDTIKVQTSSHMSGMSKGTFGNFP